MTHIITSIAAPRKICVGESSQLDLGSGPQVHALKLVTDLMGIGQFTSQIFVVNTGHWLVVWNMFYVP